MASRLWDRIRSYNPNWPYATEHVDYGMDDDPGPFGSSSSSSSGGPEIVVRFPSTMDDASDVADNLKRRQPIIVNLQNADGFEARRIVDFLSGVTFAMDGHMQKVGEGIFLFTPRALAINSEERPFLNGAGAFASAREASY